MYGANVASTTIPLNCVFKFANKHLYTRWRPHHQLFCSAKKHAFARGPIHSTNSTFRRLFYLNSLHRCIRSKYTTTH
ncbi:hypothetical protein [Dasychira pudibunda nucleopolyhedrovirus]|nr:hypothetical protein [Dasychira pudibunda nucleopolyhedrovirus]WHM28307.1 hypothetical protein [Dasychira pudibunda nucleopolyhedrovirus]